MKRALIVFLILFSLPIYSFAQQKLEVSGDLAIESESNTRRFGLILRPQTSAPFPPSKGQVYYCGTNKQPYYYDGSAWKSFFTEKRVATKIVAAYNSLTSTRDGLPPTGSNFCVGDDSSCINPQADYTCGGVSDQVKIQQAIEACTGGGAVYLLEGTYNLSDQIILSQNKASALIGTGDGTLIKVISMATILGGAISTTNVNAASNFLLSQLRIDVNNISSVNGIMFYNSSYCKIEKVRVENGLNGIALVNTNNSIISGCSIKLNTLWGIQLSSSSSSNRIIGNNIQSNAQGIAINSNSGYNLISGNNIESNKGGSAYGGIYLTGAASNNSIVGNNIKSNDNGISLDCGAKVNVISGNNIYSNVYSGIKLSCSNPGANDGFNVIRANMLGWNNITERAAVPAMEIDNFSNNIISGNYIFANAGNQDGIRIKNLSSKNIISSNFIRNYQIPPYGIDIVDNNCSSNYIFGDGILPSWFGFIFDNGTLTKYTGKAKISLEKQDISVSAASYTLNTATNPRTYVYLIPSVAVNTLILSSGKAAGDILIIENSSSNSVTLNEATCNCNLGAASRVLGLRDTIQLVWNGSKWLEVKWVNNL